MTQERMANFGQFQKLYDYFTSPDGGMNPVQASGMLGNIYAESKGNPMALNRGDGRDGSDSVGLIQHNSDRAVALREFAANRGEGADMLMSNAMFITEEGRGVEASGYNRGMAGETPEDAALGFAQNYIRPAAEHIPERAGYGRMMYDTFAGGGDPNEALAPGLSYSPQQGEDLANNAEEVDKASRGTGYKLSGGIDDPMMARLYGLANQQNLSMGQAMQPQGPQNNMYPLGQSMTPPQIDTGSPMQGDSGGAFGPTQERATPQIITSAADVPVQQAAPTLPTPPLPGEDVTFAAPTSNGPGSTYDNSHPGSRIKPEEMLAMLPSADELDEMVPTPEGQPNVSEQIDANLYPLGVSAAEAVGADPAEAPTSMAEVADAITNSEPTEEDDEEAAAKKKRRYAMAANMLETLSVGLGQISAGEAVDLGGVLQNQSQRRFDQQEYAQEAGATAREAAQQKVAAQQLSQQLNAAGEPELAQLALSGEDGFKEALGSYGTIMSRAPTASETGVDPEKDFYDKTPQQRFDALKASGVSDEDAAIGAKEPGLGYQLLADFGDRVKIRATAKAAADLTAKDEERNVASSQAMIDAAIPYRGDKAVKSAMAALAANPQDNAARSALQQAIVSVDPEAVTPDEPISPMLMEGLINQAGVAIDPKIAEAAREGDPRAIKMVEAAADAAAEKGGENIGENRADAAAVALANNDYADTLVDGGMVSPQQGEVIRKLGYDGYLKLQEETRTVAEGKQVTQDLTTLRRSLKGAYNSPEARAIIDGIVSTDMIGPAMTSLRSIESDKTPASIRELEALAKRPGLMALKKELLLAESGDGLEPGQSLQYENLITRYNENNIAARNKVSVANEMRDIVTTSFYADPTEGGAFTGKFLIPMQALADDILGSDLAEGLFAENDEVIAGRLVQAVQGKNFGPATQDLKGAVSDRDADRIIKGMPDITDSNVKRALLAQLMIRAADAKQIEADAQNAWLGETTGDVTRALDGAEERKFVKDYMETSSAAAMPLVDPAAFDTPEKFEADFRERARSGELSDDTVIFVPGANGAGNQFLFVRDYRNALAQLAGGN
tara:strand:- start:6808 stop:10020 length:3213 start_codon:yes stop_codon:yes gene_type:complete